MKIFAQNSAVEWSSGQPAHPLLRQSDVESSCGLPTLFSAKFCFKRTKIILKVIFREFILKCSDRKGLRSNLGNCFAIGQLFIVVNAKYLTNDLSILSHWSQS